MIKKRAILILVVLTSIWLLGSSFATRYPGYRYVLSEFDVDESYVQNADFLRFVKNHERGLRHFYNRVIRKERALPRMIRRKLLNRGLSDLFFYVSMVESGLSTTVHSPKSAVGLWQFMPGTAKKYALHIDSYTDERYDPYASTNAAIAYLQRLHQKFGKWYVAVMAYNCGEGRMARAIAKAGTDDLEVLGRDVAPFLPKETREYIRKILLIAMMGESERMMAAPPSKEEEVQVEVPGGTNLHRLAKALSLEPQQLLAMNPQYVKGVVPSQKSSYTIAIPEEKMAYFYLKYLPQTEQNLSKPTIKAPYLLSHTVVLGESLESIATVYGANVDALKRLNGLDSEMLEVGRVLLVPLTQEAYNALERKDKNE